MQTKTIHAIDGGGGGRGEKTPLTTKLLLFWLLFDFGREISFSQTAKPQSLPGRFQEKARYILYLSKNIYFYFFKKRVYSTYVWFMEKHVSYSLKQLVKSFSFDIPRDRGAGNNAHAAQSMFFACFSTPVMRNEVFFPCSTFSLLYYPLLLLYNVRAKVSLLFLSLQIAFQKGCFWSEKLRRFQRAWMELLDQREKLISFRQQNFFFRSATLFFP